MFEANQGKAHAINAAIQVACGDIIAVTDDDCIVDPRWLMEIKTAFDRFDCIAVGGRIVPVWTVRKPDWLDSDGPFRLMAAIVEFDCGDVSKLIDIGHLAPISLFAEARFKGTVDFGRISGLEAVAEFESVAEGTTRSVFAGFCITAKRSRIRPMPSFTIRSKNHAPKRSILNHGTSTMEKVW